LTITGAMAGSAAMIFLPSGLYVELLAVDGCAEGSFQDVNPLFIRMRMRFGPVPAFIRMRPTIMRSLSTQGPCAVE
jgi:hypothetical protein